MGRRRFCWIQGLDIELTTYRLVYIVYGINGPSDPPNTARASVAISSPSFSFDNIYDVTTENTSNLTIESDTLTSISAVITPTSGTTPTGFNPLTQPFSPVGSIVFGLRRSFKIDLPSGSFEIDQSSMVEQISRSSIGTTSVFVSATIGVFSGDDTSLPIGTAANALVVGLENNGTISQVATRLIR